jgi:hypothetical protein
MGVFADWQSHFATLRRSKPHQDLYQVLESKKASRTKRTEEIVVNFVKRENIRLRRMFLCVQQHANLIYSFFRKS